MRAVASSIANKTSLISSHNLRVAGSAFFDLFDRRMACGLSAHPPGIIAGAEDFSILPCGRNLYCAKMRPASFSVICQGRLLLYEKEPRLPFRVMGRFQESVHVMPHHQLILSICRRMPYIKNSCSHSWDRLTLPFCCFANWLFPTGDKSLAVQVTWCSTSAANRADVTISANRCPAATTTRTGEPVQSNAGRGSRRRDRLI